MTDDRVLHVMAPAQGPPAKAYLRVENGAAVFYVGGAHHGYQLPEGAEVVIRAIASGDCVVTLEVARMR